MSKIKPVALKLRDKVQDKLENITRDQTEASTWNQIGDIDDQVWTQVDAQVWDQVWAQLKAKNG